MMNKKRVKTPIVSRSGPTDKMPQLNINEKFVEACENGDYVTVIRILDTIKDFNIDVTDNLGRTALRLAVENEHLEVVQVLLDKSDSPKIREALLLAIYSTRRSSSTAPPTRSGRRRAPMTRNSRPTSRRSCSPRSTTASRSSSTC